MQKLNIISKKTAVIISILVGLNYCTSYAQISCASPTNTACGLIDYLGWDATVGRALEIRNNGAYPIDFYTNGTKYMTILGSTNPGYVGIGSTSPSYKLDVKETANNANATIRAQATGTNGNANLILNKTATGDNCMVNYKYGSGAGLVNLWAAGCRTNDDFSIYNESLAATNFMVQKSTGANTLL